MIDLNVFTNSTNIIKEYQPIHQTINSFKEAFGDYKMTIWCDRNPNTKDADEYIKTLNEKYDNVNICDSLSDGYTKAIHQSKSDFLFMLEHDYLFNKERIHHSLEQICEVMKRDSIHHLRFNILKNRWNGYTGKKPYNQVIGENKKGVPYIRVAGASNRPHLLNKQIYIRDLMKYINVEHSSFGIEQRLQAPKEGRIAVYGDINHLEVITHIDGRQLWVNGVAPHEENEKIMR